MSSDRPKRKNAGNKMKELMDTVKCTDQDREGDIVIVDKIDGDKIIGSNVETDFITNTNTNQQSTETQNIIDDFTDFKKYVFNEFSKLNNAIDYNNNIVKDLDISKDRLDELENENGRLKVEITHLLDVIENLAKAKNENSSGKNSEYEWNPVTITRKPTRPKSIEQITTSNRYNVLPVELTRDVPDFQDSDDMQIPHSYKNNMHNQKRPTICYNEKYIINQQVPKIVPGIQTYADKTKHGNIVSLKVSAPPLKSRPPPFGGSPPLKIKICQPPPPPPLRVTPPQKKYFNSPPPPPPPPLDRIFCRNPTPTHHLTTSLKNW